MFLPRPLHGPVRAASDHDEYVLNDILPLEQKDALASPKEKETTYIIEI